MTGRELLRMVAAQVCVHGVMTGTRLAAPLLALQIGYSAAQVGVMLALFALSPVLLALAAGRMADKHGLRLPMHLAIGGATLGAGIAAIWPIFPVLCVSALLTGAAAATTQISMQRHVGRAAKNTSELKAVFSWMAIAPALGNFLGPLIAGLVIDHAGPEPAHEWGFRAAFAVLALMPLITLWLLRGAHEAPLEPFEEAPADRSVWDLLSLPQLRLLLLVNWMQSAAWDVHTFVVPILGHERGMSASTIGILLGVFAAAAAAVRVVLPILSERVPEWGVVLVSTVVAACALVAYPLTPGAVSMGVCSAVLGVALGAVQPMIMSVLHQITPANRQGEAMALRIMTLNFSSFLMPMLFGSLGAVLGVGGLFWLVGGLLGLGAPVIKGLRVQEAPPGRPGDPR